MGKGFTLVELSIVLVIISLLVGGIMAGKELIQSASNNKDIAKLEEINRVSVQFMQKFGDRPGDYRKSLRVFGTCRPYSNSVYQFTHPVHGLRTASACVGNCSCNGNGDSTIRAFAEGAATMMEESLFWLDLERGLGYALSPMAGDNLPGILNWFADVRAGFANEEGYAYVRYYSTYETSVNPLNANAIWVHGGPVPAVPSQRLGYTMPSNLYAIDNKIDDSLANSGTVRAGNYSSQNCFAKSTGVYNLTVTNKECFIFYRMN